MIKLDPRLRGGDMWKARSILGFRLRGNDGAVGDAPSTEDTWLFFQAGQERVGAVGDAHDLCLTDVMH